MDDNLHYDSQLVFPADVWITGGLELGVWVVVLAVGLVSLRRGPASWLRVLAGLAGGLPTATYLWNDWRLTHRDLTDDGWLAIGEHYTALNWWHTAGLVLVAVSLVIDLLARRRSGAAAAEPG